MTAFGVSLLIAAGLLALIKLAVTWADHRWRSHQADYARWVQRRTAMINAAKRPPEPRVILTDCACAWPHQAGRHGLRICDLGGDS